MQDADIWGASALQLAWHAAMAETRDDTRRCAEGRQLSEREQAAWREQITERYGAVA